MPEGLRQRLDGIRERINKAAVRAGRNPEEITLVAVSKTFDAASVQRAIEAGVIHLGENYIQEASEKISAIDSPGVKWHMIGHLQSNKARLAVQLFDYIHTIDNVKLVERLDRIAGELHRNPSVLVQVDLGHEATKAGAEEHMLPEIIATLDNADNLNMIGLMTMPPLFLEAEQTREYFIRLREICDSINSSRPQTSRFKELSMGMSHDFEVAIEEGATMIRIGTAIFGQR